MTHPLRERLGGRCPVCLNFHAHFVAARVMERCAGFSPSCGFGARPFPVEGAVFQRLLRPELQVEDMDARGIDLQLISSADIVQGRSELDRAEEALMAALVNDCAADWVRRYPRRFIGSCVLPLGDQGAMLKELERAVGMGLRVVVLPSNYRGLYLGHERYDELWSEIEALGLTTFIHPDGTRDRWFQDHALWNSIGQSIEEVKAMSSLIYEGVLDRHPGLKLVMAHGGGYMPHSMGRLDRNAREKPWTTARIRKLPSEYLRDFWYDSCVFDPRTLELLVERVGADRVLLGSDYPVAVPHPLDELDATRLDDGVKARIAGANALQLLGLDSAT
jgi:aminocarboxymuconate-semialdehyde decarboxylase